MSQQAVVDASSQILTQLGALVSSLSDGEYTHESEVVAGGTIGKHVRHALDHFDSAVRTAPGDVIDYDHRERGTDVETSRASAEREVGSLVADMSRLDEAALSERVTARVMCTCDDTCAELGSTRGREIFFAMHHAIHHNAIIKAIACELGAELDPSFGMAPSTVNHEKSAS